MSAIAGFMAARDRCNLSADLARALDVLASYGPDRSGVWSEEGVALGHRLLITTPESEEETQPIASTDGALVLTADARLDNRDDLTTVFGLDAEANRTASDSVDGPGHPRRRRRSPERRRTRGYAQNRQRSISAEPEAEPRGQAEDDGFDNEPPIDGRETEKSSQQTRDPPR